MNKFDQAFIKQAHKQGLLDENAVRSIAEDSESDKSIQDKVVAGGHMTADQANRIARAVRTALPPEIPGYKFLNPLGTGTTSVVWKAEQISLSKTIAIKVFSNSGSEDHFKSLISEARNAARLNHPHIVHALDAGMTGDVCWFSMEYVEGETLQQKLKRRGTLSDREVSELALCISQALSHAHKAGLLHRDLKPANILISDEGTPKITDLGLAVSTDKGKQLEHSELLKGTPHYISPEQIKGERVDEKSDLYSLGATLYHCLTGKPPFEAASNKEILKKHVKEEVIPVVTISGKETFLDAVTEKLLSKNPDDRYASADELIETLNNLDNTAKGSQRSDGRKRRRNPAAPKVTAPSNRQVGGSSRADLRSNKTMITKIGTGIGLLLSVFMIFSALSQASKGKPDFEVIREERRSEVSKLKIERRMSADEKDYLRHEESGSTSLTSILAQDQDLQIRALKAALRSYGNTKSSVRMVEQLDFLQGKIVEDRQADGRIILAQARSLAGEGRLWNAIETLDERPRSARQDRELNSEIEKLLSVWEDQIDDLYESDSQKVEFHRSRREFDTSLTLIENIKSYADPDLIAEAEKIQEQILIEKATFVKQEGEKRRGEEFASYKAIWPQYRELANNRGIKEVISLAVGLDSELAIEEFKSRINTDLEAFQILDGFIKNSLQAMVEKGEDKKEIELVRVPLKGSTRDRKDRGVVERVDTENVWLRLSDQNAVMPFRINELKDAFIFQQVAEKFGKSSQEYRIPMGILAIYRGNFDVASEHFRVLKSKGTNPETWEALLEWARRNS